MRLEIMREVLMRMKVHLREAGRREIGGILMAEQIEPDYFRIVDFSVDTKSGGFAHFVRSPEHAQAAMAAFYERTGSNYERFNYLGEWHSHPSFPAKPSTEDVASMVELVHGEREIHFAVLIITRLRFWGALECSACVFARNELPVSVPLSIVDKP
jgi:[CysO sulfur-carrier protein]-S-L-cysteine hydrolase